MERANAGQPITFFEATTATAFKLFADNPADVLLLEVGLGGRFDATNVIETPLCAVVTPVSIDHVEFLGDTVEKIAFEKAGIFKRGAPAVLGPQSDTALAVLERGAARLRAPLSIAGQDYLCRAENGRMIFQDDEGLLDLPLPRLPGAHQIDNAGTAIAALRRCFADLPEVAFAEGVAAATWPGRLQRLNKGKLAALAPEGAELWLDGGHNAAGGAVLSEALADFARKAPAPLVLLYGSLQTKDSTGFLHHFVGLAPEIFALPVTGEQKGRAPEEIVGAAHQLGLAAEACNGVEAALRILSARNWPTPPRILICGSLYLAGEILNLNGTPPD